MNEGQERNSRSRGLGSLLISISVIGVIIIVIIFARGRGGLVVRDPSAYQVVFLDNDQVYFGKLGRLNDDFWSLTDIYYLRAGGVQQGGELAASQIDLIKLGAEIHAPRDEMIIGKSHVVFYEDIGAESEVMKLINQHKQQQ